MSKAFTSAGTKLEIAAEQPASHDASGFQALTYTQIGEVTDIGEYGAEYEVVTHNPIAERRTIKRKGTKDDGSQTLQLARVPSDAGQSILIEGADGTEVDTVHSFKVTLQDGTVQYYTGQIYSFTTNIGGSNQIVGSSVTVELDNEVIEVAA